MKIIKQYDAGIETNRIKNYTKKKTKKSRTSRTSFET